MSEVPHMPTKEEILAKALELFLMANPGAPTPEEDELREGGYWEEARRNLMSGTRSQLEGYLADLESEAESIRDELGIKPDLPPKDVRELEEQLDSVTGRLHDTRSRLKEAKETIERLREVKIPAKVIAPPPEKPICPAHKQELIAVIGPHEFRWGRIDVPSEMFLFQCPMEFEYYVCEPRKACVLVSLDKLKLQLARIIKPIEPARPPTEPRIRNATRFDEAAETEPNFTEFLAEVGINMEQYKRLDRLAKFTMRSEYRRWKMQPY